MIFNQLIISGLATGSIYVMVAIALIILYKGTNVINFAISGIAIVSTYFFLSLVQRFGLNFFSAIFLSFLFSFSLGFLIQWGILSRAKKQYPILLIIICLGLELILQGITGLTWGPEQKSLPFPFKQEFVSIIGYKINLQYLLAIVISILLLVFLYLFFKKTKIGLGIMAVQQNELAAQICGIPVKKLKTIVCAISAVIGNIAGLLVASISNIDTSFMLSPLIKGLAAAVLGGLTSFTGAIIGGYALGVVENIFAFYVSFEFKELVAFIIIFLVLWIRPSGLFGFHYKKKV